MIGSEHLYRLSRLAGPGFFAVTQDFLVSALDMPNHCFFTKTQPGRVVTCSKGAMWYVPVSMLSLEMCSHSHITSSNNSCHLKSESISPISFCIFVERAKGWQLSGGTGCAPRHMNRIRSAQLIGCFLLGFWETSLTC